MSRDIYRIRPICPAPGWRAVFWERLRGRLVLSTEPIACWAHAKVRYGKNGEYSELVVLGLVAICSANLEPAEDMCNFIGYSGPGENTDRFLSEAMSAERLAIARNKRS